MPTVDPRTFDQTRPIVLAAYGTLAGHELHAGHPLTVVDEPAKGGEVTADTALRLWTSGKAVYADVARPTPVETPEAAARREVDMEALDGGWHMIRAPWLPEAVKVQGAEAAATKLQTVIADGVAYYEDIARGTVVLDTTDADGTQTPLEPEKTETTRTRRSTGGSKPDTDA